MAFSFGNTQTQPAQTGGGLFGGLNTNTQNQTSSSLFGQNTQNQPAQQSTGFFGQPSQTQQPQQTSSIFGQPAQQNTGFGQTQQPAQQSSIFGQTQNQQPQQSSFFGQSAQQQPQQQTNQLGQLGNSQLWQPEPQNARSYLVIIHLGDLANIWARSTDCPRADEDYSREVVTEQPKL
jgi:nucleoporin p58/p45